MKANPMIDALDAAVKSQDTANFKILYPAPSTEYFSQQMAFDLTGVEHIIFVCGRYEGIDFRFDQYCMDHYPSQFMKISLGKFIVYGGEVPSMMIMEAITRILPGGTNKPPLTESYYPEVGEDTIENPHYTRPQEIYGYKIPEILVSGHHKNIEKWREDTMS